MLADGCSLLPLLLQEAVMRDPRGQPPPPARSWNCSRGILRTCVSSAIPSVKAVVDHVMCTEPHAERRPVAHRH